MAFHAITVLNYTTRKAIAIPVLTTAFSRDIQRLILYLVWLKRI